MHTGLLPAAPAVGGLHGLISNLLARLGGGPVHPVIPTPVTPPPTYGGGQFGFPLQPPAHIPGDVSGGFKGNTLPVTGPDQGVAGSPIPAPVPVPHPGPVTNGINPGGALGSPYANPFQHTGVQAPDLRALGQEQAAAQLWESRHPYAMSHGNVPDWVLNALAPGAGAGGTIDINHLLNLINPPSQAQPIYSPTSATPATAF